MAKAEDIILGHKSMQIRRHTPEFLAQSAGATLPCGQVQCDLFLTYSAACSTKERNVKERYVKWRAQVRRK